MPSELASVTPPVGPDVSLVLPVPLPPLTEEATAAFLVYLATFRGEVPHNDSSSKFAMSVRDFNTSIMVIYLSSDHGYSCSMSPLGLVHAPQLPG